MFLITGITGNTGSSAAEALLASGRKVRALVRDRSRAGAWAGRGVELVGGDATDRASLTRAMQGAEGAYLLVPPHPLHPDPISFYEAVAEAAREAAVAAGLAKLVFLSSEAAHLPSGTGPIRGLHRAEAILSGAVPSLTFLRACFFQENWRAVIGLAAEQGIIPTMLANPDAKRPMVATADIGRTAAHLLTSSDAPPVVELGGPELYSANDAAAAMSAALGRAVTPVQPPREAWTGILTQAGLGPRYAELLAEMYEGINSGHVHFSGRGIQQRGHATLSETVQGWVKAGVARAPEAVPA
jgi:uncharacterized protein YbjT (DUF2867 family)